MVVVVDIGRVAVEFMGRNAYGNQYKYRWAIYTLRTDGNPYGLQSYYKGEFVPAEKIFIGTKPEVKRWLKERNLTWDWEK